MYCTITMVSPCQECRERAQCMLIRAPEEGIKKKQLPQATASAVPTASFKCVNKTWLAILYLYLYMNYSSCQKGEPHVTFNSSGLVSLTKCQTGRLAVVHSLLSHCSTELSTLISRQRVHNPAIAKTRRVCVHLLQVINRQPQRHHWMETAQRC